MARIASSGVDRPAAAVVGVLQADEPGADGVHVVRADLAFEVGDARAGRLRPSIVRQVTPLSAAGPPASQR